jgi:acyl transferase domain-containing protein
MNNGFNLDDITYTLQIGRKSFSHRWLTICSTLEEAMAALDSPGAGETQICLPGRENTTPLDVGFSSNKEELTQTGQLWLHGQEIDWKKFYAHEKRNRIPLPTYPFEVDGQHYWIEGNPFDMNGFKEATRDFQAIRKEDIADWFYLPRWSQPTRVPSKRKKEGSLCFLMFSDECPLVLKLVERLRSANTLGFENDIVITVKKGQSFEKKGDREFVIDSRRSADYETLFSELNRMGIIPQRIVHTWNVSGDEERREPGSIGVGFYSLLHLARTIGKQGFAGEIRIDVLTTGIQEITGNELLVPEKAAILGPLKVIPQEYPFIICRSIDIELPPAGSPVEDKLADCLSDELFVDFDSPDTDIAYRGYFRWVKIYEPIRVESPKPAAVPVQLRERGVYLVTGGYGNIGFTLAGYLAEKVRARLILTGPSPLIARAEWDHWLQTHESDDKVSRKIMKIRQLEAAGGEVLIFTADAANKDAMGKALRNAEETFGPINGVIHAAGLIRGKSSACPIEETGEAECNEQFGPKIQGVLVLADLFKNRTLDFCILTSSLSPILGGLGFAAYSAASAFMDVFA